LQIRQLTPVSKVSGAPLYAACGFPVSIKRMLYDLKFQDKIGNGTMLAEVLAHYWQQLTEAQSKGWMVIPIPTHQTGGHTHMPLIGRPFASHFGYDFVDYGFVWNRPVAHQHTLLNRRKRQENMAGALSIDPVFARQLTSRSKILIVDDLLTTGATLSEAIAAVRRVNPMIQVCALTVSEVPFAIPRLEHKNNLEKVT
jgi:predicted amidophosphoribosyltransferase